MRPSSITMDFKTIISTLGVLCLFAFSGCSSDFLPPQIDSSNQHFENKYFSIDVPGNWKAYVSASRNGNRRFDFLDPNYAKIRIRVTVSQDPASLSDDSNDLNVWERLCLMFEDLFSKDFAIRSRANIKTQINGKPANINVINTDEFDGYVGSILGKSYSYKFYYWQWKDFSQETKDRIEQVIYSIKVP